MTFSGLNSGHKPSTLLLLWAPRDPKGTFCSLSFKSHLIVDGFLLNVHLTKNAFTPFQEMFWWE